MKPSQLANICVEIVAMFFSNLQLFFFRSKYHSDYERSGNL